MSADIRERRSNWPPCPAWMGILILSVAACSQSSQLQTDKASFDALLTDPSSRPYRVISAESILTVRVYREGSLAVFGHNHVISSDDLQGVVYLADPVDRSALEIRLPLLSLDVDRPEHRAAAGDDFPGLLDEDAIAATRRNMLGEQQLDVLSWPELVLRSRAIDGAMPDLLVHIDIALQSGVYRLSVPVRLVINGTSLVVSGAFSVDQTELGLEPFSIMMGALRVRDRLDIAFRIVARQTDH